MTKSELFIAAHREARQDMESGAFDNYREAFSDNLKGVYITYRLEAKEAKIAKPETINDVKKSFWASWNQVKASRYSKVPGSRQRSESIFDGVCEKLRNYSETEINKAFGKYAGFVISKAF